MGFNESSGQTNDSQGIPIRVVFLWIAKTVKLFDQAKQSCGRCQTVMCLMFEMINVTSRVKTLEQCSFIEDRSTHLCWQKIRW